MGQRLVGCRLGTRLRRSQVPETRKNAWADRPRFAQREPIQETLRGPTKKPAKDQPSTDALGLPAGVCAARPQIPALRGNAPRQRSRKSAIPMRCMTRLRTAWLRRLNHVTADPLKNMDGRSNTSHVESSPRTDAVHRETAGRQSACRCRPRRCGWRWCRSRGSTCARRTRRRGT